VVVVVCGCFRTQDREDLYPLIGARVNDRYIIRDYMANGSFAHVWKAFDTLEQKQARCLPR
jgi:hypothetical protein